MTNAEVRLLAFWVHRMRILRNIERRYVALCLVEFIRHTGLEVNGKDFVRMCMNGTAKPDKNGDLKEKRTKINRRNKSPEKV